MVDVSDGRWLAEPYISQARLTVSGHTTIWHQQRWRLHSIHCLTSSYSGHNVGLLGGLLRRHTQTAWLWWNLSKSFFVFVSFSYFSVIRSNPLCKLYVPTHLQIMSIFFPCLYTLFFEFSKCLTFPYCLHSFLIHSLTQSLINSFIHLSVDWFVDQKFSFLHDLFDNFIFTSLNL